MYEIHDRANVLHFYVVEALLVVRHRHARINLHSAGHLFVSLRIEPPEMDEADISLKRRRFLKPRHFAS